MSFVNEAAIEYNFINWDSLKYVIGLGHYCLTIVFDFLYSVNTEKASEDIASTLIQSRLYRDLIDFDNHLDDISLDWRNVEINDQIAVC